LFGLVFEDAEILLLEAIDESAAVVENGGVENDEVDVDLDGTALLVGALIRRRRLRARKSKGVVLRKTGGSGTERRENEYGSREGAEKQESVKTSGWERSSRSWRRR
jgi:hypothetical protein